MSDTTDIGPLAPILSDEPEFSPPVKYTFAGKEFSIVFRELSEHVKQVLRYQAIGEVERMRRQVEADMAQELGSDCTWRDVDIDLLDMRTNRWNALMLHAASRRADDTSRDAFTVQWLENRMGSELFQYLMAKYAEFSEGLDQDQVSPENVQNLIEDIKKNDLPAHELWGLYGSATLWLCLRTLVDRLASSQTDKPSDTSSNG